MLLRFSSNATKPSAIPVVTGHINSQQTFHIRSGIAGGALRGHVTTPLVRSAGFNRPPPAAARTSARSIPTRNVATLRRSRPATRSKVPGSAGRKWESPFPEEATATSARSRSPCPCAAALLLQRPERHVGAISSRSRSSAERAAGRGSNSSSAKPISSSSTVPPKPGSARGAPN